MRAFIGAPVSPGLRTSIEGIREELVARMPELADEKWVNPENLHLTVKFLGDISSQQSNILVQALRSKLKEEPAFDLVFDGLSIAPSRRSPRMIWATCRDPSHSFQHLHAVIDSFDDDMDVHGAVRAPRPHITVVRFRRPRSIPAKALEELAGLLPDSMSVPSVTLYSSTLTRQGPVYESIAEIALSGD